MSGSREAGLYSGQLAVGEVIDVNDPWQAGHVKVRWRVGSAAQDQLGDDDVPWTRVMFPPTNPSLGGVGGPHTGLKVGSKVYGSPTDGSGQDFLIVGTLVAGGKGDPDQEQKSDSDVPAEAKEQTKDGLNQPRYGDRRYDADAKKLDTKSIIQWAADEGADKKPAKYTDPTSIGNMPPIV